MDQKFTYEQWINHIANHNGCIQLLDFEEVTEDLGDWVLFKYQDKTIYESVFFHEIQN